MTRQFFATLAVLWGLGLGTVAACPTRARVVVVDKVVVNRIVVAEVAPVAVFVPFAVAVPQYSVSYGAPPYQAPAYAPPQAPVDPCAAKIAALQARLDALEGKRPLRADTPAPKGGDPKSPADVPAGTAPPVFAAKCAACHQAGREKDGGGLVLLNADGSLARLTDRQLRLVGSKTYAGKMPPPDNKKGVAALTDQEAADIQTFLDAQK